MTSLFVVGALGFVRNEPRMFSIFGSAYRGVTSCKYLSIMCFFIVTGILTETLHP